MEKMPVLFVGHGSPMNAIEDNVFTKTWVKLGESLPCPKAIVAVSAHWYVPGAKTTDAAAPRMIYDMYGFPKPLYEVTYKAAGAPALAGKAASLANLSIDNTWGMDHGVWSVLCHLYPKADIPVLCVSVDRTAGTAEHYALGKALAPLRSEGVLIFGSGNIVHNLRMVDWEESGGYSWADEFDEYIKQAVENGRHDDVVNFTRAGSSARLAVPTPDHYLPLLPVLGAAGENAAAETFNYMRTMGSISMTGYVLQ